MIPSLFAFLRRKWWTETYLVAWYVAGWFVIAFIFGVAFAVSFL